MTKYVLKRLLHGIFSILVVVFVVMLLVYSTMDRDLVFATDSNFTKLNGNQRELYKYQQWERYGYIDYVPYGDYLLELELDPEERSAAEIGSTPSEDSAVAKKYVQQFTDKYEGEGYTVVRMNYRKSGQNPKALFAYKDINVFVRFWSFLKGIVTIDNIHNANGIADEDRKISFTWYDPAYYTYDEAGNVIGKKFSLR